MPFALPAVRVFCPVLIFRLVRDCKAASELLSLVVEAVLAEPLFNLHDVLLSHLSEVSCALRVKPAAVAAVRFVFAHDEVAGERVELSATLAKELDVLAFVRLIVLDLLLYSGRPHLGGLRVFVGLDAEEDALRFV